MATQSSRQLTHAVKEDHEEMYEYYDQYNKASGDKDAQERWANQLTWEVARHAVGEELVVYPLMEKYLGAEGKRLADEDRAEHQYVKERLYKLESLQAGSAEHSSLLKDVMDHLRPHNDSEEQKDLPALEKALAAVGAGESEKAAASFSRTKKFAPTRAHPSAPNKPPFETLAGLLAAPIDKLKDAFTKFPTEEQKEAAEHN
ncbi:hypothetical protein CPB83DRAFT_851788 [Crepidotus variabilis]|uniref:Hemerythrin-like domain-containing protein n=1 Tax=Crepidotus variabilis TaxID=179855 RepID=A0A9P6JQQ0_9AGAR|nr:hypothetical protein CPB83DRAFT_851788 [Crepidotus variabilis]